MTENEGRKLLAELIAAEADQSDNPGHLANPDDQLDPENMPVDDVLRELQRRDVNVDEFGEDDADEE